MLYHNAQYRPHTGVAGTVRNRIYTAAAGQGSSRWVESSKDTEVRKDRQGCNEGAKGTTELKELHNILTQGKHGRV